MSDPEKVTEQDMVFSVQQFMAFLSSVDRSNKCPVCPHKGDWSFHTDPDNSDNIRIHAIGRPGESAMYTPIALMECPQCGFIAQTNLLRVYSFFHGVHFA